MARTPTLTETVLTYDSICYVGPRTSIVLGVVSTPTWRAGGAQRRVWEEAEPLSLPGEPQVTLFLIPGGSVAQGFGSVFIFYGSGSGSRGSGWRPIRIRIRIQSGSRAFMTKNWKKITAEKKIKFFFDQKLQFIYP